MELGSGVAESKHFLGKIKKESLRGSKVKGSIRILLDLLCALSSNNSSLSFRSACLRQFLPLLYLTLNQLAYLPLKPVEVYAGTSRAWKWVLWLRLDYIVVQLDQQVVFLYAIWSITGVLFMLICVFIAQLASRKWPPERLKELFQWLFSLLYTLFPVPVVHFLLADLLTFLRGHSACLVFQSGSMFPVLSAISLMLFVTLAMIREIAALTALCSPKHWHPGPRSNPFAPLSDLLSLLLSSLLYLTVPLISSYFYYGLFAFLHSQIALFYYRQLPLYNEIDNFVHISCHLTLTWGGIAMLIGDLIDSDYTGVMLLIVVTPALIYALHTSWKGLYWRVLSASFEDCNLPQSRNSITLIIRTALMSGNPETIKETFSSLRKGSHSQLVWIGVLEASYSLQVLRSERQARLQLAEGREKAGWVDLYLRYRLWHSLQKSSLEEVAYLHFLHREAKVYATDEGLCRDLSEFWTEVASQDPKRFKINTLIDRIVLRIGASKRHYEGMLAAYSDNSALLDSYAAFLRDILLKPEKAVTWDAKARIVREAQLRQDSTDMTYGQEGTGVLVVDLSSKDAGQIIYCNEEAADMLQYDGIELSRLKIYSLLPQQYANQHMAHFRRLCSQRNAVNLQHPQVLPLLTSEGYLLEVTTKAAFTCLGGAVLLVLALTKVNKTREIALITSEGQITATSQGFVSLLGLSSASVVGESLYVLCPALFFAQNGEESAHIRANPSVFGAVRTVQYGSQQVHMALLYAVTNHAHIQSLAEAKRRSSIEKLGNLFSSSVSMFSSHQSVEKQDFQSLKDPNSTALESRLKDRPKKKGDNVDKRIWSIGSASTNREVLVKARVKQGINRAYLILASVAGIIMLLMVIWTIAIALYLITVTRGVIEDSVTQELSERIVHTARIAGQGRFLDLINAGFFPEYMTEDVKSVILESVRALESIEKKVWGTLSALPDGAFKDLMLENKVLTWELSAGTPEPHLRNLVNAMKVFLEHSRQLLDFPISSLSIRNSSLFYLVRNGLQGEFTQALNHSLHLFTDIEQTSIKQNVSSIIYLLVLVFLSLGIALAISIPAILCLQQSAAKVSSIFMSLPLAKCIENKQIVVDRLRFRFGVELETGLERPKKQDLDFVIFEPLCPLMALVTGFLLLSVVLYLVLFLAEISTLTDYVSYLPKAMLYYAQRFTGFIDLWTWTVEVVFSASVWPFSVALPCYAPQLSPDLETARISANLKDVSQKLLEMADKGYLPYSSTDFETVFHSTNYTSPVLKKGLRPGFVMYSYEIVACSKHRGASEEMCRDCGDLYNAAGEMVNVSRDVLGFLKQDFETEVQSRALAINYWLVAWVVLSLFFLLGCLLPILYKSRRHVLRMIALGRLVRMESRDISTNV